MGKNMKAYKARHFKLRMPSFLLYLEMEKWRKGKELIILRK